MKKYPMLMRPVSKEIIWGGDKLKREYNKTAPFDKLAESWELSVRNNEMCIIDNGEYAGVEIGTFIGRDPVAILGSNAEKYDRFPLLIKFIDANDKLSIQVHPDNEYSLEHEGELGKTEMWYIIDAEPGAKLVYGLTDGCTVEELAEAVESGKTEGKMCYVEVKPGDVYFIPSGQVHAIGAGILIAEIQQNSNITYRVYDYERRQADGSLRQLHTEKALDVIKVRSEDEINAIRFSVPCESSGEILCSCEYFTSVKYKACSELPIGLTAGDDSFISILVIDADNAVIMSDNFTLPIAKGESYFIPAGTGEVVIDGKAEIIVTTVN
ncbi:MAG: class I mannose-6-phosphate isomerase [Ruminococcaceae bacterium]|nr:class I mannose-6-phosphate isomerase [Oscillospiraceae bacterium]